MVRDEGFPSAGRRTLRPSTAVRAVRFRGTGTRVPGLVRSAIRGFSRRPRLPASPRRGPTERISPRPRAASRRRSVPPRARAVRAVDRLELLEAAARADRDARERALGEVHGHLRLVAEPLVEPLQQRAAAGEHDAAIHDVRGELGRRLVERRLDRVDDLRDRLVERAADLLGADDHRLREAGQHVAAADLGLDLLGHRVRGADLELDLLGRLLADEQLVVLLDVVDDRLVHLVAADAERLRDDDPAERDDGDLGRAAADVDDHVPGRLGDGEPGADRGGHRLLDQVRLARAGRERRLLDRALLDAGDAGRDADDDARVREAVLVHLLDEVAEHLLGDVEVGDHAVLERADRRDRAGRPAEHALRLDADRVHVARCAGRSRRPTARRGRSRARGRRRACWRCRGRRPCRGRRSRSSSGTCSRSSECSSRRICSRFRAAASSALEQGRRVAPRAAASSSAPGRPTTFR